VRLNYIWWISLTIPFQGVLAAFQKLVRWPHASSSVHAHDAVGIASPNIMNGAANGGGGSGNGSHASGSHGSGNGIRLPPVGQRKGTTGAAAAPTSPPPPATARGSTSDHHHEHDNQVVSTNPIRGDNGPGGNMNANMAVTALIHTSTLTLGNGLNGNHAMNRLDMVSVTHHDVIHHVIPDISNNNMTDHNNDTHVIVAT
jgi:hypothetical protein